MSILNEILEVKKQEIAAAAKALPFDRVREEGGRSPRPRGFAARLSETKSPAIIAELKRASPSAGIIRADFEPVSIARDYSVNGAACLSVLTDQQFFKGDLAFIPAIRAALPTGCPILRKDFIIDRYQVWETRLAGADALLLIISALSKESLSQLFEEAAVAGLDVLIEVHDEEELKTAISLLERVDSKADLKTGVLLGINNRNLKTFKTDLGTTKELIRVLRSSPGISSERIRRLNIISESGIYTAEDIHGLIESGANGFLIGESLLRTGNPGENLARLIAGVQETL